LSALGSYLRSSDPAFDPRLYGYTKLSDLVRDQRYLAVTGTGGAVQVRSKSKSKAPAKKITQTKTSARKAAAKGS
jgi:hypothetical protein